MIRFFAQHPTAANIFMLLFIVIGIVALPDLRRETFPDFASKKVEVRILYAGASAYEVEETICRRIEDAVDVISDLAESRCEARESLAIATLEMHEKADSAQFIDDVRTEIEAIDSFPAEIEAPTIRPLNRVDHVASIAVTGEMPARELKAYAEQLKDSLLKNPLISQVVIQGFSDQQLRIALSHNALRQYGLSVMDVAQRISQQSLDLPVGDIKTHEQDILLRFSDARYDPQAFADLIILGGTAGGEVRLGNIAQVYYEFENAENKILFNGQRAALLQINKTKIEDSLRVGEVITQFIASEQQRAPRGVSLTLTQDKFSVVTDRLQMLLKNGWQGLLLVGMSLWLFFNFRFSFWVVMGLPVSFLGTLFFMQMIGQSINMLTMVGLLIAIGLLMDDAIVIAENIATHVQRGKSALNAAIDGVTEVGVGIFSSFLTTLCMFLPMTMLSGDIGKVLQVMPVVLILTLTVSLVEAFLILPNHMVHALHDTGKPSAFRQRFDAWIHYIRDEIIGKIVVWAIRWRYGFVAAVIAVFIISVGMLASGKVKFKAFPDIEGDIIEARILLPQGTPLAKTEEVIIQLTTALHTVSKEASDDNQSLVKNVQVQFNSNRDAHETGAHVATLSVDLLSTTVRAISVDEIIQRWKKEVGVLSDVLLVSYQEPARGPSGLPIEIYLQSNDLEKAKAASNELMTWLQAYKGVFNLLDDLRAGKPEVRITLKEGALALGFTAESIAQQLRAAYHGRKIDEIQVGDEAYELDVRLQDSDKNSLADLENFSLSNATGVHVPLSSVAYLHTGQGYARIHHIDGQRTVTIQGDVDVRYANVSEIIADTKKYFLSSLQQKYPRVNIHFAGEIKEGGKTGKSIAMGFLIGLIGVFALLSIQFRGYLEPFVVMIAIPLSLIGVIWGHLLMGYNISMPSMIGFVSLSGIVVNDSILLVTFLKNKMAEGVAVHHAAAEASRARFRAVLLTSLTTIMGLIPLLSETSVQAQTLIPLVISLAFGLVASTILILIIVPALYTIFEDFGFTSVK